ncbi:MAG: excalibur calcium-binding domain-containing protein [Dehalococcoidia bacterium]
MNYDLNCPDVGYKNFRVVGVDKHRFDADKDGIACES